MAEDQATHVIYKSRHYIIPGKHGPEEAYKRVLNLTGDGPKLQPGISTKGGFEDTSGDAARILEQYHEPNRARDVLPRLASFAALGSTAALPAAAAGGAVALRGLPVAAKAATVAKFAGKTAAIGAGGVALGQGLQALGVPPFVSEAIVAAGGLSTKPGRALIKAGFRALAGESAAAPAFAGALRSVPAVAAEAAPAVAAVTAPDQATIVLKLQQQMETTEGRKVVRELLNQMPKEQASQIRLLLARGQAQPGTAGATALAPAAEASPLQAPRIEIGAQNVGRAVGMKKEQVRTAAGPVLDEALGAASPVLPRKAIASIAEKIKTLPLGAERDAYVALANSSKAMLNIEVVRRTLESQGMVLPFAAVAGLMVKAQLNQVGAAAAATGRE